MTSVYAFIFFCQSSCRHNMIISSLDISSHRGELLNSKSEWHQAKVIRTTVRVAQGGAEILQPVGRGEGDQPWEGEHRPEPVVPVAKVKVLIVNAAPSNI